VLLRQDTKSTYLFAGIGFHRKVICDKAAIMIKTSNRKTRHQSQIQREQAWRHAKKSGIFTLAGPGGLDPRPPNLSAHNGWFWTPVWKTGKGKQKTHNHRCDQEEPKVYKAISFLSEPQKNTGTSRKYLYKHLEKVRRVKTTRGCHNPLLQLFFTFFLDDTMCLQSWTMKMVWKKTKVSFSWDNSNSRNNQIIY